MVKRVYKNMKIGRVYNFGMGNSIMTFIFQIDLLFINYSYIIQCCPGLSQNQRNSIIFERLEWGKTRGRYSRVFHAKRRITYQSYFRVVCLSINLTITWGNT